MADMVQGEVLTVDGGAAGACLKTEVKEVLWNR